MTEVGVRVDEALARAIHTAIHGAYSLTLTGGGGSFKDDCYRRAKNPEIGDLVAEMSTYYYTERSSLLAVGYLRKIAWEPVVFSGDPDFVWDEEEQGCPHPPPEKVYYIDCLAGHEQRWVNANIVAAPVRM